MAVNPIPDGYHVVTPYLTVAGVGKALEFYKKAFGAVEVHRMTMPGSDLIMHAEIVIGDSKIMMSDDFGMPGAPRSPLALGGACSSLHIYTKDVDTDFQRAVDAGCEVAMPVADAFWGDRWGMVKDPFGHFWGMATHIADPTPEEMMAAAAKAFGRDGGCCS